MNERVIRIDSALAVQRVSKLLPQWLAWGLQHDKVIEVVAREHVEARTVEQNSRMWAMLSLLEQHGVVCESTGRTMSAAGWHEFLRVQHGYIYGTRSIPISDGAGGWQMIECPSPQPTRKGAKGQMSKADHSSYMERIHDELHVHGISFDEGEWA